MDSDYDPQQEAEAAMKLAVAADGAERQRLIGLAMAWQELARIRPQRPPGGEADKAA
ncbi:hypothetical protein QA641_39315 [Bradyrhizobium sp. CB1650]|uniref:hypothetical protein n=1 Tax=Bradyrhizobium sp. CB1650 TaxID=3039153 RepID=UPI0024349C36|nr:hypothetical protein [Bradyrhizobium sp. CB1650]WGD51436.1 hypothetical protein QA641_39315 [Bradyrhizobium sp. CB1650]